MAEVISFKDAVLELQKLRETAKKQEAVAEESALIQRVLVATDAYGNKKLIEEEEVLSAEERKIAAEEKDYHKKSLGHLANISKTLSNISGSLDKTIANNVSAGNVSKFSDEESKEESDVQKEFLVDKLIEGLTGLKKSLDVGLTKIGKDLSGGFGKLSETYKNGGGGWGGIKSLFESGKNAASGGWKGLSSKAGAMKDAFSAGRAEGGIGKGLGRAFSSVAPESAGALSRGMGTAGNMIKGAGGLATGAAIGLAGVNIADSIFTNMNQSEEIEKNVASGALTRDQGNVLQGESLGDTAGTGIGAAIGGFAGSALGPAGTALGAWAGSKVGGWIGGGVGKYGVKAYQGIKGMLGFGESQKEQRAKMSPEQELMNRYSTGEITPEQYNKELKLMKEGGSAPPASTEKPPLDVGKVGQGPTSITPPGVVSAAGVQSAADKDTAKIVATPTESVTPSQEPTKKGLLSEWGSGIKSWFGGTKLGQAWAERNKGVGTAAIGETMPEMKVGSAENLKETDINGVSTREMSSGVTTEKTALGSTWLGKLMSSKGTETENFLAESDKAGANTDGKYSQFMGKRENGGWFGADKYSIGDKVVDKDTYMKAKDIASAGGDASQISGLLDDYEKNKTVGRGGNRSYDTTNKTRSMVPLDNNTGDKLHDQSVAAEDAKEEATKPAGGNAVVNAPTVVNNTTNSTSTMRSPFKNEEASVNRYMRTRYGAY